jgi:clathrin heavy chain
MSLGMLLRSADGTWALIACRVVRMFEKSDNIPLIKPFLLNVQPQNNKVVNSAINDLLIEEEDYKTLRDSVENYDNYDPVELAQRLEKHE